MSIFSSARGIIERYGLEITVAQNGEKKHTKAFIQPLRYNSKYYGFGEHHKTGFLRTERYLYIGPPDIELISGESVIESVENKYIVMRTEIYRTQGCEIYAWAILTPYGEAVEDEYEADTQTA